MAWDYRIARCLSLRRRGSRAMTSDSVDHPHAKNGLSRGHVSYWSK